MKLKVLLSLALIAMIVAGCTTPPNGTAIVLQYPDDAEVDPFASDGTRGVNTATVRELKVVNNATVGGTLTVTGGVTGANVLTTGDQTVAGVKTLTGVLPANAGITVDTTAFTVADTSGNVATTGTLTVGGAATIAGALNSVVPVLVKDATYPLTAADSGSIIKNTAAAPATFTLPAAAAGLNYCFYNYSGNDVVIEPVDGVDTILKLTNSAGDSLTNTTAFDVVCLTAIDATNWANLQTGIGTWADGN